MKSLSLLKVIIPAAITIGVVGSYSKLIAFALLISGALAFVVYFAILNKPAESHNEVKV